MILTDGDVEEVLALTEKRRGGDHLVADAIYWKTERSMRPYGIAKGGHIK